MRRKHIVGTCLICTALLLQIFGHPITSYANQTNGLIAVEGIDNGSDRYPTFAWNVDAAASSYQFKHESGTLGRFLESFQLYTSTNKNWFQEPVAETIKNVSALSKDSVTNPKPPSNNQTDSGEDDPGTTSGTKENLGSSGAPDLSGLPLTPTDLENLDDEEKEKILNMLGKSEEYAGNTDISNLPITQEELESLSEEEVQYIIEALNNKNALYQKAEDADLSNLANIDPLDFAEPFTDLDKKVSRELKVIMASAYHTLAHIAAAGLVFSLMIGGLGLVALVVNRKPGTKEEIMTALLYKILAFMIFCSIVVVGDFVLAFTSAFT